MWMVFSKLKLKVSKLCKMHTASDCKNGLDWPCWLSQKDFLKFSFAPKNQQKYFCISALVYKERSNKKK